MGLGLFVEWWPLSVLATLFTWYLAAAAFRTLWVTGKKVGKPVATTVLCGFALIPGILGFVYLTPELMKCFTERARLEMHR
jgi:hypothetical protein